MEVETEGELTVALDTTVTEELRAEGMAREFVNRVQNLRKNAQLQVSDRITVTTTAAAPLAAALERYRDYVCAETLALEIKVVDAPQEGMETVDVDGYATPILVRVVPQ